MVEFFCINVQWTIRHCRGKSFLNVHLNFAFCGDIGIEEIFYLKNYPKVVQNGDLFLLILCRNRFSARPNNVSKEQFSKTCMYAGEFWLCIG